MDSGWHPAQYFGNDEGHEISVAGVLRGGLFPRVWTILDLRACVSVPVSVTQSFLAWQRGAAVVA